ncbi:MAG: Unknown protein [uncultured Aureispira sp.]|uniref:Uncharacterized protein n=1 Tax=uncultured Aureispira sp. TaxID=1331704 RepID=A0A6S6SZU7_9BACT|nr:MAG: Unknown protein [uncultured Aureispira sp.]
MLPLKIRYQSWFLAVNIIMAFLLILLSWYTHSLYRVGLGAIWMLISLNNIYNNSILELTDEELILRNGLGVVAKRYSYKESRVVVRDKAIYLDDKRVYKHLFTYLEADFERIRDCLVLNNPELNLDRHLIEDELDS